MMIIFNIIVETVTSYNRCMKVALASSIVIKNFYRSSLEFMQCKYSCHRKYNSDGHD